MSAAWAEVIGDPIRQSKSPTIHGFWLAALGLAGSYRATHVVPDELADWAATRRADAAWCGSNVTMPHKQAVMALLDGLDPLAARVGAVNTVVPQAGRLIGYNTDVGGFFAPLATRSPGRAQVLGNGGAARAVVIALADAGWEIVLAGRDPHKARALLDELAPHPRHRAAGADALGAPVGAIDLLVNASPLGMTGQPALAFDLAALRDHAVVYDIVTSPVQTALLNAARSRGLATCDGLTMLIGQADHAFAHFFGQSPPRDHDAQLRAQLDPVALAPAP